MPPAPHHPEVINYRQPYGTLKERAGRRICSRWRMIRRARNATPPAPTPRRFVLLEVVWRPTPTTRPQPHCSAPAAKGAVGVAHQPPAHLLPCFVPCPAGCPTGRDVPATAVFRPQMYDQSHGPYGAGLRGQGLPRARRDGFWVTARVSGPMASHAADGPPKPHSSAGGRGMGVCARPRL